MRVMILLKSDAATEAGAPPNEQLMTAMGDFCEEMVDAGVMLGGEGLHPSSRGAKIRIANGRTTVIDGPFAEAKEVIAGYTLMRTTSLAEAIDWAKRMPTCHVDGEDLIELRPLYEPEDFPIEATETPAPPGPEKGLRWLSLLKADENTEAAMTPSTKLLNEMGALISEMAEKGILISGDGLKPSSHGARVHISRDKRVRVVDGPFAEAKELVAGITSYRAHTKAEAIEWARRCLQIHVDGTGIDRGEIEVRQVFETDEIPVTPEETPGGWRDQDRRLRERMGQ